MKHLISILQIKKHRFDDLFEEANYKITLKFSFFIFIAVFTRVSKDCALPIFPVNKILRG